jgi:ribosomal protein L37E
MSEPTPPAKPRPITPIRTSPEKKDDPVLCDRCGAEVYRMHAVWRCPACGFKSDCCGW